MDQKKIPIFQALQEYSKSNHNSFHVPGHKSGEVFPFIGEELFSSILKIDITEITNFDDLHAPDGIIKEAQDLTAAYYGAIQSYFLVGGSSAGNLAMILSVCSPGDTVLVQRNCHKSIIHGLHLAGVTPVFLSPFFDEKSNIAVGPTLSTVREGMALYKESKAIILTYPNYYGMASKEMKEIIAYAKESGLFVLVDEAHGAHFCLEGFPPSTIKLGADIIVQSAHKTLPAMTMGSFLHVNSSRVDKNILEYYLQVFQTSSPSYPILASLDIARFYIANLESSRIGDIRYSYQRFRDELDKIPQITIVSIEKDEFLIDPIKITIQTNTTLTGYEIQTLFEEINIQSELSDPLHVLLVLPLQKMGKQKVEELVTNIANKLAKYPCLNYSPITELVAPEDHITTLAIPLKKMSQLNKISVPLKDAVGYVCGENIIPYPPGIPVLMAGERINSIHLNQILTLKESGATFQKGKDIFEKGIKIFLF